MLAERSWVYFHSAPANATPCGIPGPSGLVVNQVLLNQTIQVAFPQLQPPIKVYGTVTNAFTSGAPLQDFSHSNLFCMEPISNATGNTVEWKVAQRTVQGNSTATNSFPAGNVGDFVYFYAEEMALLKDGGNRTFVVSDNYTIVNQLSTSGSALTGGKKYGLILLAGLLFSTMLSVAV